MTVLIVLAVLLAAIWSAPRGRSARSVQAMPQDRVAAELQGLPGSPGHALRAGGEEIGQAEARRLNAAVPFAPTPGQAAAPFRFLGSAADRLRATDCLALAAMAEAGGGDNGQRAVIQVVLNRVLHPAFAKTVCGVVFEGSHRATGCQFTFTCDGGLARRHSLASWAEARSRAAAALDGRVYPPVGLATHYHTDWVHPYWSDSLVKLARIDTHLFFRWPGRWGNGAALAAAYRGGEPAVAQLAYLAAHNGPEALGGQETVAPTTRGGPFDVIVRNGDGGAFMLLAGAPSAASARDMGRSICADRPSCKVFGWFDRALIPAGYPIPVGARAYLGFSYYRGADSSEIVLYDCARFGGVAAEGCIPTGIRQRRGRTDPVHPPLAASPPRRVLGTDELAASTGRNPEPLLSWKELP